MSQDYDEDEEDEDDERRDARSEAGSAVDSDDDEAQELAQRQKLLNEEIRDLESAVSKKKVEIERSSNVIIKVRSFHLLPSDGMYPR